MFTAMIVDDEKWTLMGLCRTFRWDAYGFELAFSSTDPDRALEYLLTEAPDAAFLDIRMPGITGLEMMEKARELGLTTEFVIVSGIQDFSYAVTCIRQSAFDYCLKPLSQSQADDILAKLKDHLTAKIENGLYGKRTGGDEAVAPIVALAEAEPDEADNFANLVAFVDNNFTQPLLVKDVSAQFFLTPNYVSSLFRRRLNTTFTTYLNDLRIKKAVQLLVSTNKSVEEIALACGYSETQYFIRVFRSRMQLTPLKFRKGQSSCTPPSQNA